MSALSCSIRIAGLLFFAAIATHPAIVAAADPPRPVVKVVEDGESQLKPEDVLTTVLGPGVNQPDPYPGYGGFVGWVSPIRLRNGDWVLGFSAGYWHASAPTPLRFSPGTIAEYQKMGLPKDIVAPTGGVAMIMRSTDEGKTWDKEVIRLPSPFLSDETNGPLVLLKDGSILLTVSGTPKEGGPAQAAFFTSQDRGATWKLLSTIKADHNLDEANATQLPDGRLVMMARPEGDISTDGGQTWIAPAKDHGFLVDNCYAYGKAFELPDGTLLVADQGTGGHTTADAKSMSLRLLRVRIRPDHSGIDLLPGLKDWLEKASNQNER